MRRKIKIKIKHLIFIPIFIFIIFPNVLYGVAKGMYTMDFTFNRDSEVTSRQYSYGVFKLYSSLPKISPFKGEAYFYLGKLAYNYSVKTVVNAGKANIIGYGNTDLGSYEEAVEFHRLGLKNSDGSDYSLNTIALFNLYMEKGERKLAEKLIQESLSSRDWKKNSAGKALKIQLAVIDEDMEELKKLCEETVGINPNFYKRFLDRDYSEREYYFFDKKELGDSIYIFNETKLLNTLMNTMESYTLEKEYSIVEVKEGEDWDSTDEEGKKIRYVYDGNNITVKGRITLNGEPLKHTAVAVGNVVFNGYVINGNIMQSWGKVVYTDRNGEYEAKDLVGPYLSVSPIISKDMADDFTVEQKYINDAKKDGVYTLDLEFKEKMKIDVEKDAKLEGDKFEFTFDKIQGADYYEVGLVFTGNGIMRRETIVSKDNRVELSLVDGSLKSLRGYERKNLNGAEVEDLTGVGKYKKDSIDRVEVKAIKEVDERQIVLNNKSVDTNIKSKARDINKGEKLILEGKEEEGIKWLEEKIKSEGYTSEYIYPLLFVTSRMGNYKEAEAMYDSKEEREKFFSKERLEKAQKAEKILLEELYKINNNEDEIEYFKELYEVLYNGGYGIID